MRSNLTHRLHTHHLSGLRPTIMLQWFHAYTQEALWFLFGLGVLLVVGVLLRYWRGRVRIAVRLSPAVQILDPTNPHASQPDTTKFVFINVSNRGELPTTITHIVLAGFDTHHRLLHYVRAPCFQAVALKQGAALPGLPYRLRVGADWHGVVGQQQIVDLVDANNAVCVYVGVHYAKSTKPKMRRMKHSHLMRAALARD